MTQLGSDIRVRTESCHVSVTKQLMFLTVGVRTGFAEFVLLPLFAVMIHIVWTHSITAPWGAITPWQRWYFTLLGAWMPILVTSIMAREAVRGEGPMWQTAFVRLLVGRTLAAGVFVAGGFLVLYAFGAESMARSILDVTRDLLPSPALHTLNTILRLTAIHTQGAIQIATGVIVLACLVPWTLYGLRQMYLARLVQRAALIRS